jgi:imidazolonepropionase-like amidohydrolase
MSLAGVTAVRAARLIDGTGRLPVERPVVLIEDGRFRAIHAGDTPALPAGARLVDCGDATLLPGLIDCHEHLAMRHERGTGRVQMEDAEPEIAFRIARTLTEIIQMGVTSVRTAGDKNHLDVAAARYVESGYVPGPRVYPSGAGIRSSHGHGDAATTVVDGVDAVRRGVRESIRKGSHHIKLFVTGGTGAPGTEPRTAYYTPAEIQVAVEEAHNAGRKLMAHAHGGPGVDWLIDAGADSIEHGAFLTDAQIERMARAGTWYVPTLAVSFHDHSADAGRQPPEVIEKRLRSREFRAQIMARALAAGVRLAAGTDSWHGEVWYELELLVRFGLTPMQALFAATRDAADLLGHLDDIGTVESGKRADLIAVMGDPLEDISVTRRVALVLRDGIPFVDRTATFPLGVPVSQ